MFNGGIPNSKEPPFFPYGSMSMQNKEGIFGICIDINPFFLPLE